MEDSKKEKEIVTSPEPVSFEGTKNIFDQIMEKEQDFLQKFHIKINYYLY